MQPPGSTSFRLLSLGVVRRIFALFLLGQLLIFGWYLTLPPGEVLQGTAVPRNSIINAQSLSLYAIYSLLFLIWCYYTRPQLPRIIGFGRAISGIYGVCFIFVGITHFVMIDKVALWHMTEYPFLSVPGLNGVPTFLHRGFWLMCLIFPLCNIRPELKRVGLVILAYATIAFTVGYSRQGLLVLLAFLLSVMKTNRYIIPATILFYFTYVINVLGRGSQPLFGEYVGGGIYGYFFAGYEVVKIIVNAISALDIQSALTLALAPLTNMLQSVIIISQTPYQEFHLEPEHLFQTMMSVSSAIDGYNQKVLPLLPRINDYVPMACAGFLTTTGVAAVTSQLMIFVTALTLLHLLSRAAKYSFYQLILVPLLVVHIYMFSQYSCRQANKYLVIEVALSLIFLLLIFSRDLRKERMKSWER